MSQAHVDAPITALESGDTRCTDSRSADQRVLDSSGSGLTDNAGFIAHEGIELVEDVIGA